MTNVTYDDLRRRLNSEMDLLDFLRTAKDDVKYLDAFKEVHVVLGNPSCDLDSTVSSIIHSCYLSKISNEESRTIIPVLNIPREDYPLRTEVTSFLSSQEINETYLIFRDDIDLRTLAAGSRLKLTLVDHNVLATEDADQLDSSIVQIIDHHDNIRKNEEGDREIDIHLEPVGSCTTLVVENILNKSEELLDERTASLALGTILLDTVNLSTTADRTTEKDKEMVDKLSKLCPNLVHQEVFDQLQQSKFDVTGLSAMDILRKDLKSVSDSDTTIGLSSIPCSIEVLLSKSDENEEERGQFLQEFCKSRSLSALLLVAAFQGEDGNLTRELGVFSPDDENDQFRTKLTSYLSSDAAGLLLEEQSQHFKALSSFHQGNVKASRKVILPHVQRFLEEIGLDAEDGEKGNNREADGESASATEDEASGMKVVDTADLLGSFDPEISPETNFGVAPVLHDNTNNSNIFIGNDASSITLQHDMHINNVTFAQNTQHAFDLLDLDPISTTALNEQPVSQKSSDLDDLLGFDPFSRVSAETKIEDQRDILQAQGSFLFPDQPTNNDGNSLLLVDFSTVHEQPTNRDKTEDVWSSPMNEEHPEFEVERNIMDGNAADRSVTFGEKEDAKSGENVIWINSEERDNVAESVDLFAIEEVDLQSKAGEEVAICTEQVSQKESGVIGEEWNRALLGRKSGKFSATLTPNNSFGDLDECERTSTPQLDEDELSEKVEELHRSRSESLIAEEFENENNQTGVDSFQIVAHLNASSGRLGSSIAVEERVEDMQHLSLLSNGVGHVGNKETESDISDKFTSDTITDEVESDSAQRQFTANLLLNEDTQSTFRVGEAQMILDPFQGQKEKGEVMEDDKCDTEIKNTSDLVDLSDDLQYLDSKEKHSSGRSSSKHSTSAICASEGLKDHCDGQDSPPEIDLNRQELDKRLSNIYDETTVVNYAVEVNQNERKMTVEEKEKVLGDEPDREDSVNSENEQSFVEKQSSVSTVDEEKRQAVDNGEDKVDEVITSSMASEDQEEGAVTSLVDSEVNQSIGKETVDVDIVDEKRNVPDNDKDQEDELITSSVASEDQEDGLVTSPGDSEDEQSIGKERNDRDIMDEERNELDKRSGQEDEAITSLVDLDDEQSVGKEENDVDIVDGDEGKILNNEPDQEDEVITSSVASEHGENEVVTSSVASEDELSFGKEEKDVDIVDEEMRNVLDNKTDQDDEVTSSVESEDEQSFGEEENDEDIVDEEKRNALDKKPDQDDEAITYSVYSEDEQSFGKETIDVVIVDEERNVPDNKPDHKDEVITLSVASEDQEDGLVTSPVDSEDEQYIWKEQNDEDTVDEEKRNVPDNELDLKLEVITSSVASEDQEDGVITSPVELEDELDSKSDQEEAIASSVDSEDEQYVVKKENDVFTVDEEKGNQEDEVVISSVESEDEQSDEQFIKRKQNDEDIMDEEKRNELDNTGDEVIALSVDSEGGQSFGKKENDEDIMDEEKRHALDNKPDQEDEVVTSSLVSEDEQSFEKEENELDDKPDQEDEVTASSVTSEDQEDGVVTSSVDSRDEQSFGKAQNYEDILDEEKRNELNNRSDQGDEVVTSSVESKDEHAFQKEQSDEDMDEEKRNVSDKESDQEDEVITSSVESEDEHAFQKEQSDEDMDEEKRNVSDKESDQEDEVITSSVESEDEHAFQKEQNDEDIVDEEKRNAPDNKPGQEDEVIAWSVASEDQEDGAVTSSVDLDDEQSFGKAQNDGDILDEEKRNVPDKEANQEDEVVTSSVESEDEHAFQKEQNDEDILDEEKRNALDNKPDQENEVIAWSVASEDQEDGVVTSSVESKDEHAFQKEQSDGDIVDEEKGKILNNEKDEENELITSSKSTDNVSTAISPVALVAEQSFGNEINEQGIVDLEKGKVLNHEPNEKDGMIISPVHSKFDPSIRNIPHESDMQIGSKEGWFENDLRKTWDKDHNDSMFDEEQNKVNVEETFQDNPFAVNVGVISGSDLSLRHEPISVDNQTSMVIGKGHSEDVDSGNTFLTGSVVEPEIENKSSSHENASIFHSHGDQSMHPIMVDVTENQTVALVKGSQYTDDFNAELKRKAAQDTDEKLALSVETSSPINPFLDEPNDKNEDLFDHPNPRPTDHRSTQIEPRSTPQRNPFSDDFELLDNDQHIRDEGDDSSIHMAEDGFLASPLLEVEKKFEVHNGQVDVECRPSGNPQTNPFTVKVSKEHHDESLNTKDKDGLSNREMLQDFEADSLVTISAQSLSFQTPCEVSDSQDEHLDKENTIKVQASQQIPINPFAVDLDAFSDNQSIKLQNEQEDLVHYEHGISGSGSNDALPKGSYLFSGNLQKDISKGDFFVSKKQKEGLYSVESETNPFKSDSGLFGDPLQSDEKTEQSNDNIWEGLISPEETSHLAELPESVPLVLTDDKSQEFAAGDFETDSAHEELRDKTYEHDHHDTEVTFDPIETFQKPVTAIEFDTPDQKVEEEGMINVSVVEEVESSFSSAEMRNAEEEHSDSGSDKGDRTQAFSEDRSVSEVLSSKKDESVEVEADCSPGKTTSPTEVSYGQDLGGKFGDEDLSIDKEEDDQEEVDHNEIDYNNSSQYLINDDNDGTFFELSATSKKENVYTDREKVETEVEDFGNVLKEKESDSSEADSASVQEDETMSPKEVDHNEMDYNKKYHFVVNDAESEETLEITDAFGEQQIESQRHQMELSAGFSEGVEDDGDRVAITDTMEEQQQVDASMDEGTAINLEDVDIDMTTTTEKRNTEDDEDMATAIPESAEKDEQLDDDDESTAQSTGSENITSVEGTDEVKEQLGMELTPTQSAQAVEDKIMEKVNETNLAMSTVAVKQEDSSGSHKKPVKISSNFTDLEAKQFELSLKPPGSIKDDEVTSPNLSDLSESGVDMSPSHHSSSPKIRPSSLSLSDMSINSNKGVAVALPHTDTPTVLSPSLESLSSTYSHEGYLASPDQDDTPTPVSDVKSMGNMEDGEPVYKRALSVDSELNRNVNRGWGDNQSLLDAILLTQKTNEEVIDEMPQAEADIQAETNPQGSGEEGNERGEAEGAEEDDADKISIKITRKNPPTISPDVQVLVDEADGGRGRLDTLLSDTSIGEFDYTIDDDDDEDEEETEREAKGAYSGAADSPNRKRLSAELALHLEDGTSITTEIIDAAYPAVLTPSSTEMSWDDDASVNKKPSKPESIPEYTAKEEHEDRWRWRKVKIGDTEHTVDNKVIEPYKKVLSHGGYYGDTMNAIIVIASCYLPERSRKDYQYVMHNLFLYVVSSLELLVAQDYMIVYFHGAAPRSKVPSLGWMKRCYQMIDRRLKKNLKGLYIIHPTGWLKTVITFTRPFISAKFYRKLKFIYRLSDLEKHVSMEYIYIPEEVKRFDETKKDKAVRPPSGWIDSKPEEIPSISNGFPSPPYNARPRRRRRNPYPEADQSFMPQDADDLSDLGTEGPDSGRSSRRMSFSGSLGFFEDDFLAYAESHQPCSIEEYLMQQRELFEQLRQEAEEEYDLENVFP